MSPGLILVLFLVLAAEFTNGLSDAANAIATVVGTRVLTPARAVIMAAVLNLVGVIVTGAAVAATIGKGIVRPESITLETLAAAMLTVVVWTMGAWVFGIPTSETHELLAGIAGAGLATAGPSVLLWDGWRKVLIGLGVSTLVGFGLAFLFMTLIYLGFRRVSRTHSMRLFGRLQVLSAAFMAFSHGSNDGQKFMGVFAAALVAGGWLDAFEVPMWVMVLCGLTMGLGTALGGWRIIKTMGSRVTRLDPSQGFAAETAAGAAILLASRFGIPLSTTHTIGTAIMGVGATRRISAVNWGVSRQIVMTWLLTFPGCLVLGMLFAWLFQAIL